jgi:hypothetical protein
MNKETRRFAVLVVAVLIGFCVIVPLQLALLASPELIAGLGVTSQQSDWKEKVVLQASLGFWLTSSIAVLIWNTVAENAHPVNSHLARSKQFLWWSFVAILYIVMILTFYLIVSLAAATVAAELQYLSLLIVVPIDMIFGFWLPTALATPGSLRFVPPLAMNLRRKLGV